MLILDPDTGALQIHWWYALLLYGFHLIVKLSIMALKEPSVIGERYRRFLNGWRDLGMAGRAPFKVWDQFNPPWDAIGCSCQVPGLKYRKHAHTRVCPIRHPWGSWLWWRAWVRYGFKYKGQPRMWESGWPDISLLRVIMNIGSKEGEPVVTRRKKRRFCKTLKRLKKQALPLGIQVVIHKPDDGNPPAMAEIHLKSFEEVSK